MSPYIERRYSPLGNTFIYQPEQSSTSHNPGLRRRHSFSYLNFEHCNQDSVDQPQPRPHSQSHEGPGPDCGACRGADHATPPAPTVAEPSPAPRADGRGAADAPAARPPAAVLSTVPTRLSLAAALQVSGSGPMLSLNMAPDADRRAPVATSSPPAVAMGTARPVVTLPLLAVGRASTPVEAGGAGANDAGDADLTGRASEESGVSPSGGARRKRNKGRGAGARTPKEKEAVVPQQPTSTADVLEQLKRTGASALERAEKLVRVVPTRL